jgi:hypothetical protein
MKRINEEQKRRLMCYCAYRAYRSLTQSKRERTLYYHSWYCAKRANKNLKRFDHNRGGFGKNRADKKIKVEIRSRTKLEINKNDYLCLFGCKSHVWNGKKYICLEGKAISIDWVEKNL